MVFLRHPVSLKAIPVDAATVQPDDKVFDSARHRAHFAICPDAGKYRKPKR